MMVAQGRRFGLSVGDALHGEVVVVDDRQPESQEVKLSPIDPSLESNPVPRVLDLATSSIGSGAATDASSTFTSAAELAQALGSSPEELLQLIDKVDELQAILCEPGRPEDNERTAEQEHALVEAIRDRTWGFYLFVTGYEAQDQSLLPSVLDKLVRCVHFSLQRAAADSPSHAVADEAWQRFRLDVVQDSNILSNASFDRLRAAFVAFLRAKRPDFGEHGVNLPMGPRNNVFLVLDSEAIRAISGFEVPDDYTEDQEETYEKMDLRILKAVSGGWERPERSRSSYRGWHAVSPMALPDLFLDLGDGDVFVLEDIFNVEQIAQRSELPL
ncbi:hypothetical protein M409DRAFT_26092 [Zasmidium cellare ATCC 36951]|uniref:Uncharacterized protein n=1 Tax=Zasmidium cellare ATCC 36951 TaxID=1080233 RepID=A0A6A6CBA0_ZASCE|nr:uncharacterized protein M409DRAFT_26092 [Zasmidium cellare ATCC 36951]KAF2163480.1 hypothetical protein M409DRAFT_26092 [Zasmidium cellare ATCC 36951]